MPKCVSEKLIPLRPWFSNKTLEFMDVDPENHSLFPLPEMIPGWWLSHPSEKYEFVVNWDDDIPNISVKIKVMFQTTNQIPLMDTCHFSKPQKDNCSASRKSPKR